MVLRWKGAIRSSLAFTGTTQRKNSHIEKWEVCLGATANPPSNTFSINSQGGPSLKAVNPPWSLGICTWCFLSMTIFFWSLLTIHNRSVTETVVTQLIFVQREQLPHYSSFQEEVGGRWILWPEMWVPSQCPADRTQSLYQRLHSSLALEAWAAPSTLRMPWGDDRWQHQLLVRPVTVLWTRPAGSERPNGGPPDSTVGLCPSTQLHTHLSGTRELAGSLRWRAI